MRDGFYFTICVKYTFADQNQFGCGPSALSMLIKTHIDVNLTIDKCVYEWLCKPSTLLTIRSALLVANFLRMRRTCSCNDARAVYARHVVLATFADLAKCSVNCLTKRIEQRWDKYIHTNQCRRRIEFMQIANFARKTRNGFCDFGNMENARCESRMEEKKFINVTNIF